MKFICQNDRYEIDTRNEFQTHMRIKRNIQRVCAYSFRFGQILFTWKSHAGLDFHFGQNDRYEIHIVLSFISPQFMWTQIKSWLKTEVRFSTKWNLITVWIHFASHVNVVLIQHAEAVVQRCSVKRCPYTIRKIHRKTLELETLAQMFFCEFCKIYKNTFATEPIWWLLQNMHVFILDQLFLIFLVGSQQTIMQSWCLSVSKLLTT